MEDWRQERNQARNTDNIDKYLSHWNPLVRSGILDNSLMNIDIAKKILQFDNDSNIKIRAIKKYPLLAESVLRDQDWRVRYFAIKNNFSLNKNIIEKYMQDEKPCVKEEAKKIDSILSNYYYRENFNNFITIKLVIPSCCNADCEFCYNKRQPKEFEKNKVNFLKNSIESLEDIILKIDNKQPISLDITGNEPTFDEYLLIDVLEKLKHFYLKDRINRITITTNGFKLKSIIPYMKDVVNYVNISVHHYDYQERKNIFKSDTFEDLQYEELILKLLDIGINTSAVCVIHKDIDDFNDFRNKFIEWSKKIGFVAIRFRNNVFWENSRFIEYMENTIDNNLYMLINKENTADSNWCQLCDKSGFMLFFLKGVIDTSKVSPGIEFVINEDGLLYADFYKNIPISNYNFPFGYIFDKKEIK